MTSIRLETKRLELDGRIFEISCNMAVLDALQTAHGSIDAAMDRPPFQAAALLLAAMLNDYAEDQGWDVRYTPKQVARKLPLTALNELDVLGMFNRACSIEEEAPAADAPAGAGEGN